MRHLPWRFLLPALAVSVAVGSLFARGAGSAPAAVERPAAVQSKASQKVTVVTVVAGKPGELAFKLSKTSSVPAGKVVFKVTNLGAAFHNFKLCTIPVPTALGTKNACFGKATPILKHGKSATLTLVLTTAGKYEFLCTVVGHAAAGMKGLLGIGVAVTTAEQKIAAKAGGSSSAGGGGSGGTGGGGGGSGGGGGGGGAEVGPAVGCPPGVTVRASGNADADGDELGTEPDDQDGCV
jgi:uncharacterized cupredoxin-like copper-binding protein